MKRVRIKSLKQIIQIYKSYGITFQNENSFSLPCDRKESGDPIEFLLSDCEIDVAENLYYIEEDHSDHWGKKTFFDCKWYSLRLNIDERPMNNCVPECIFENIRDKLDKIIGD